MGLLIFKKNLLAKKPIKDEEQIVVESKNTDDSAQGGKAVMQEFNRIYPDQPNPLHLSSILVGRPLDGISVYDTEVFWHFVSYSLSELYTKNVEDPRI